MKKAKILYSFISIVLLFIISSCSKSSQSKKVYKPNYESSVWRYTLIKQSIEENYYKIEYEIEIYKEYNDLSIEKICINPYQKDEIRNPQKIRINGVEIDYTDNYNLSSSKFNLIIFDDQNNGHIGESYMVQFKIDDINLKIDFLFYPEIY